MLPSDPQQKSTKLQISQQQQQQHMRECLFAKKFMQPDHRPHV